jgi:hypothetical protein
MSTLPDNEFDLEKLFLPAWAQEEPSSAKYAKYEGGDERPDRHEDRRGPRAPRREGLPGPRREGNRPRGERRGPPRPEANRQRFAGGEWSPRGERGEGEERRGPRRTERREPPPPLPEINATLFPEEKGVESLARQIKMTGRAYPLFDIAQMILQKPERHAVVFSIKKTAEGQPIQPLFVCALDDTLWLSEDEAVAHVLKRHFTTFYQAERTATEPPKGKYTFVAQCGMSGVILGPPNHHDYQNQLRKLHTERFSRMPFEVYKSRVRIVRDEEVVKKWVEDQSFKTEYLCLNLPEPLRLGSMEAVERHFRETHKDNIIKPVESYTLNGTAARALRSSDLARLVRAIWEDQRRFPLQIATVLSQQFAGHGLQFFKVNKTITHVSVARPHYLDLAVTPVSEGVQRIVEFINTHPKCTRRRLIEALAPSPVVASVPVPEPAADATQPPPQPASAEPTPEQNALIGDLHWLIHQGHVIEFANGVLDTAKKPVPKPPRTQPKPAEKSVEGALSAEPAVSAEATGTEPSSQAVPVAASEPLSESPQTESSAATLAPEPETALEALPAESVKPEPAPGPEHTGPLPELPPIEVRPTTGDPVPEPPPAPAAPPL